VNSHHSLQSDPCKVPLRRWPQAARYRPLLKFSFACSAAVLFGTLVLFGCTGEGAQKRASALDPVAGALSHSRAGQAFTNSRFVVSIRPLGSVPFDAMTLPLTSPSGRFVASQFGATPEWSLLLATPPKPGWSVSVPPQLRLAAFETSLGSGDSSAPRELTPISWSSPLPRGLLLGRSCDEEGFLVEAPNADGSRWIGKVDWLSGRIVWLVQGDARPDPLLDTANTPHPAASQVAAFASLGPSGELAYSRAPSPGAPFDLVVRTVSGNSSSELVLHDPAGLAYVCPTFSADRRHVYVFAIPPAPIIPGPGLTLLAVNIPSLSGSASALTIDSRIQLNVEPSISAAYQTFSSLQTPWPGLDPEALGPAMSSGIPFISLEAVSMAWFDPRNALAVPLARGTVGAVPVMTENSTASWCSGLLLGAARELVFQSLNRGDVGRATLQPPSFSTEAAVVTGAFIPRLTTAGADGTRRYLLLAPPQPGVASAVGLFELVPLHSH
jgi:hypothetical protein